MIFVFGSNLLGLHGGGAAFEAYQKHGAVWGQGEGLQGNSYALPTKRSPGSFMSCEDLEVHVTRFIEFAKSRPDLQFRVTRVGCGLAGFTEEQVIPLFAAAPTNCHFEWFSDT